MTHNGKTKYKIYSYGSSIITENIHFSQHSRQPNPMFTVLLKNNVDLKLYQSTFVKSRLKELIYLIIEIISVFQQGSMA